TDWTSRAPRDGTVLATVKSHTATEAEAAIQSAHLAYLAWRIVPAPVRGELVRRLGEVLRTHKAALGELVSLEAGKITSEGLGEVQEMIDICD
ncbi:aldehyde dehydrogenase family protein, partial [Enterobacter hormaechei]|nr:aldehyde dehydrogenase family protein [Enterobacter hormaechei]